VVVERRRRDERDDAADSPNELTVEEVPRRPVIAERGDRRRGEDHHEPDDVEHTHRRAQNDIRRRSRQRLVTADNLRGGTCDR
jgi:hypothetical protein